MFLLCLYLHVVNLIYMQWHFSSVKKIYEKCFHSPPHALQPTQSCVLQYPGPLLSLPVGYGRPACPSWDVCHQQATDAKSRYQLCQPKWSHLRIIEKRYVKWHWFTPTLNGGKYSYHFAQPPLKIFSQLNRIYCKRQQNYFNIDKNGLNKLNTIFLSCLYCPSSLIHVKAISFLTLTFPVRKCFNNTHYWFSHQNWNLLVPSFTPNSIFMSIKLQFKVAQALSRISKIATVIFSIIWSSLRPMSRPPKDFP